MFYSSMTPAFYSRYYSSGSRLL